MKNYTVYMHISPSGKRYIGITCQKLEERWRNGKGYQTQMFYKAIEKYGWNNIQHIVIARGLTGEEAKWLEIELIRKFDTINPKHGYNTSTGGEGASGCKRSEETRQKISKNHADVSGKNNGFYGKQHTKDTKQKLSKIRKEKGLAKGENNPNYGNGDKIKGKNNPNYGNGTKVRNIETGEVFNTIREAMKKYNITGTSHISNAIKRNGTCKGYHWEYVEEVA